DPLRPGLADRLVEEMCSPQVADFGGLKELVDGAKLNIEKVYRNITRQRRNLRLLVAEHFLPGMALDGRPWISATAIISRRRFAPRSPCPRSPGRGVTPGRPGPGRPPRSPRIVSSCKLSCTANAPVKMLKRSTSFRRPMRCSATLPSARFSTSGLNSW